MRRCLVVVGMLFVAVAFGGEAGDPLAAGKNLPGTFHPYNLTEAVPPADEDAEAKDVPKTKHKIEPHSTKGKFHCLVSASDLDPTVMLLARGLEDNEGLRKLLKDLDSAIDRNRKYMRLRAFVVFVLDDVNDLVEEDDKREAAAKKVGKLVDDLKLRNVVVALAAKPDVAKYKLGDDALTAVLYNKLKIAQAHRVARDKVEADGPAMKAILADVAGKLGAKR